MKEVTLAIILLFLAAVGLTELLVLLLGALFSRGEKEYLLLRGDSEGLEYRLRAARSKGFVSVLLEDSLDEEGMLLASRFSHVVVCKPEELLQLLED